MNGKGESMPEYLEDS